MSKFKKTYHQACAAIEKGNAEVLIEIAVQLITSNNVQSLEILLHVGYALAARADYAEKAEPIFKHIANVAPHGSELRNMASEKLSEMLGAPRNGDAETKILSGDKQPETKNRKVRKKNNFETRKYVPEIYYELDQAFQKIDCRVLAKAVPILIASRDEGLFPTLLKIAGVLEEHPDYILQAVTAYKHLALCAPPYDNMDMKATEGFMRAILLLPLASDTLKEANEAYKKSSVGSVLHWKLTKTIEEGLIDLIGEPHLAGIIDQFVVARNHYNMKSIADCAKQFSQFKDTSALWYLSDAAALLAEDPLYVNEALEAYRHIICHGSSDAELKEQALTGWEKSLRKLSVDDQGKAVISAAIKDENMNGQFFEPVAKMILTPNPQAEKLKAPEIVMNLLLPRMGLLQLCK